MDEHAPIRPGDEMMNEFDQTFLLDCLHQATPMMRNIADKYHLEYDDLYQEAYLLAHKRLNVLPQKQNPRGYLQRAIQSHLIKLAIKDRWMLSLDEPVSDEEDEETYADRLPAPVQMEDEQASTRMEQRIQALYAALRNLPLEEQTYLREVFQLNAFEPVPLYPYCRNNAHRSRPAIRRRAYQVLRRDSELRAAVWR